VDFGFHGRNKADEVWQKADKFNARIFGGISRDYDSLGGGKIPEDE